MGQDSIKLDHDVYNNFVNQPNPTTHPLFDLLGDPSFYDISILNSLRHPL